MAEETRMKERDTDREEIEQRKVCITSLISTSKVTTILYLEAQQEVFYSWRTHNIPFILIEFTNFVWSLSCNTVYKNNNGMNIFFFHPHHFMPDQSPYFMCKNFYSEINGGLNAQRIKCV